MTARTRAAADTWAAASVLLGALMFAWPALVNSYPILFSDTNSFLEQVGRPWFVWDKPFVYGPFLFALHGGTTLWLPLAAQVLILSHLIWLTQTTLAPPGSPARHVLVCAVLAIGSAAPWAASLLMPDIFAPVTVLALFVLAFGRTAAARRWAGILGTFAIATHLSHLIAAAACVAVVAAVRWRRAPVVAVPLALALALLVATNVVGFGRIAVSPFGSVMFLARLVGDGPARDVIARDCPEAGWRLCAWVGRLPADSDLFLWQPDGPVWSDSGGPIALAPEAAAIVWRTLTSAPGAVAGAILFNTARQLAMVRLGDTLGRTGAPAVTAYFPPPEAARFATGRQFNGGLHAIAAPLNRFQPALLAAGAIGTVFVLARALRRRQGTQARLAAMVLAATLANAVATGALSAPHDRYQARIAWMLLLPPLFSLAARPGDPDCPARAHPA